MERSGLNLKRCDIAVFWHIRSKSTEKALGEKNGDAKGPGLEEEEEGEESEEEADSDEEDEDEEDEEEEDEEYDEDDEEEEESEEEESDEGPGLRYLIEDVRVIAPGSRAPTSMC